mgnify:CR=1 FL=1
MAIQPYEITSVEEKWQKVWSEAIESADAPQMSGDSSGSLVLQWPFAPGGLTWTDLRCMALADVYSRFQRLKGQDVRIGRVLDGFHEGVLGQAIEQGKLPEEFLREELGRIESIERALAIQADPHSSPGAGVASTSDPAYYRFTQWLFLELLNSRHIRSVADDENPAAAGEADTDEGEVPEAPAEAELPQWFLDIVPFAEKLFADVDKSKWPENLRKEQKALIGRRRGIELELAFSQPFRNECRHLGVFTSRLEALYGLTFVLVAPGHEIIDFITDPDYVEDVQAYQERYKNGDESQDSGFRTGGFALNPINLEKVPVLISPLALNAYSDGVVLGIPAHDRKQFEFAKRVKLRIREVIHSSAASFDHEGLLVEAYEGDGKMTNSGPCSGMKPLRARERIIKQLSSRGVCSKMTRYSLRDLLVSGSGAWSPPVPMYHGAAAQSADSEELPLHCPPLDLETLRSGEQTLASCKTSDGADYSARKIQRGGQAVQRDSRSLLPWLGRALSYLQVALPELGGVVEGFREDFDTPCVDVEFQEEAPVEAEEAATEPPAEVPVVSQEAPAPAEAAELDGSENVPGPAEEDLAEAAQEEEGSSEGVEADAAGEVESREEDLEDEPQELAEDADSPESSELPAETKVEEEVEPASQEETDGLPGSSDESESETEAEDEAEAEAEEDEAEAEAEEDEAEAEDGVEASREEQPEEQTSPGERLRPFSDKGLDKTLPVDVVFSGARLSPKELIGIRCITKFLYMNRHIPSFEPFRSFCQVGTLSFDSKDASEDQGPETMAASSMELLGRFGADALRIQLLCLGPADNSASFDDDSLYKIRRFLEKIWRAVCGRIGQGRFVSRNVLVAKHRLIFEVSKRLEELKFHTAISALREFVNFLASPKTTLEEVDQSTLKTFLVVLKPFAPHLAFELWERMGDEATIDDSPWPEYSKELVEPLEREHAVFVNGQMVDRLTESVELDPKKLESRALALESVRDFIGRRKVGRVEVVPGRLIWICLGKNKPVKGNQENAAEDAAAESEASAGEEPAQGKAEGSEKPEIP